MIEIRPWLFQGTYRDTMNLQLLHTHNIKAMLHLAENVRHPGIATLYLAIDDGVPIPQKTIKKGIDFVLAQRPGPILIACGAGISRSTTFTAAVLKLTTAHMTLRAALKDIQHKHPIASPHPHVWQSMCVYFDERFNIDDLL